MEVLLVLQIRVYRDVYRLYVSQNIISTFCYPILFWINLCSSVLYLQYLLQTIIAKCVKNIQCYSCSEVEIKNKSLYSYSYLIKACKRIIFSFICYSSPVIKNSTILLWLINGNHLIGLCKCSDSCKVSTCNTYLSCWICERHPFPRSDFATTDFSFHLFISLVCICWYDWRCISERPNYHIDKLTVFVQLFWLPPQLISKFDRKFNHFHLFFLRK